MIDFEYAKCIAGLLADETLTEKLFCLRVQGLQRLRTLTAQYEKRGFVRIWWKSFPVKKQLFLWKLTQRQRLRRS